jgi:AcrR family transcriptional regulator
MKKSDEMKELIIKTTIDLITESDGDITTISTRAIADKAQVGTGLVNYHFQTKENLIEICVERMIGKVIAEFAPVVVETSPMAQLKHRAKLVFDFLIGNPAVSKISILSDHKNPKNDDNTIKSTMGICRALGDFGVPENDRFILAFALVSVMQALFLRREQSEELFGYDLHIKERRDEVLDLIIDNLFGGFENE